MSKFEIQLSSSFYRVYSFEVVVILNVPAWVLKREIALGVFYKVTYFVFVA